MGFRGTGLKYTGVGTYQKDPASEPVEFAYEALVSQFELEVELVDAHEDIRIFNENAVVPNGKDPRIQVSDVTVEAEGDEIDLVDEAFKPLLKERAEKALYETYEVVMEGDMDSITKLPVESFIPFLFLRHMSNFA